MANKKITQLPSETSPSNDDILAIVNDPGGSPETRRVTVSDLMGLAPVQTADIANFSSAFYSTVSQTTTSRTLSDSDIGKVIVCTNTALITVTIPTGLTSGFSCRLIQQGVGKVKVVGATGVSMSLIGGKNTTSAQYAVVTVLNYASETYTLDSSNIGLDPAAWSGNTLSVSFDGVDDYAVAGSTLSFAGAFSVSMWIRRGTQSTGSGLIFGGPTSSTPYAYSRLGSPQNGDFLIRGGPSTTLVPGSPYFLSSNTWVHVMVVRDSSNVITVYRNGSSNAGGTWAGTWTFDRFGYGGGQGALEARFDEIAVWDSDQSSNASTIYNSGTPDNLTSLAPLHWWRMGDSDSPSDGDTTPTTVPDIGSDGTNSLTLTNGPQYSTNVAP